MILNRLKHEIEIHRESYRVICTRKIVKIYPHTKSVKRMCLNVLHAKRKYG